jgi:hypothetical protein
MLSSETAGLTTAGPIGENGHRWVLEPHVCKECLGRLLSRTDEAGRTITRCADCGAELHGRHEELCCCGALPPTSKVKLRCVRNDHVTPESAAEVIVIEEPHQPASASVAAVHGTAGAPW